MTRKRDLIVVALATSCLTAALFTIGLIKSSPGIGEYDPWADINDDSIVDIYDAILLANAFNKPGTALKKWWTAYDSGWVNITDRCGQHFNITHGLNISDWSSPALVVDITGKTNLGANTLRRLGLNTTAEWDKTYGGPDDDHGFSVIQTGDGGYALAGRTGSDACFIKTDSNGNELWNKIYGGALIDDFYSIVQTSDGGFALAGETESFGNGSGDVWLVKTDANGNTEWNRTYGGSEREAAWSLIKTSDGGYALAGYAKEGYWLVKTDSNGNMQWNATYGEAGTEDEAFSIIQASDGGYAIVGRTFYVGVGGVYAWLVKTDADGNMEWNKTYGGAEETSEASSVVQTSDGGYAIGGTYAADFWLVKTDLLGNVEWNKTYGGTGLETVWSMSKTEDGGYVLAGPRSGYSSSGYDIWVVKTDTGGNMQWSRTYGGADVDLAHGVIQTSDGGYVVVGSTGSFGAGGIDFWLIRIGEFGLEWTDAARDTISLYKGTTDTCWNYVRVRILKARE